MLIFVLGFIVHIIYLLSVFDIYFRSPILNDLPVIEGSVEAQARRIVLIVGDGLRAASLYGLDVNQTSNAPYLRSILETEASWGVSHTRVPTESRPGHIAMIAGFYEDPSAIFKGWQDNLFEFDSLFNRSALTLGWGSPDIVPMFNKGNIAKNIVMKSYQAEDQSFFGSGESTLALNTWVFNAVNETLNSAEFNSSSKDLKAGLHQNGVILFLHLLGTDVSGHSDKPQSQEFLNMLKKTDEGVKQIIERIDKFYNNDGKTVYVFTSDHGMTDWGTHGDGSNAETETPFIIWGPGVKRPELLRTKRSDEDEAWGLSHLVRHDLRQADIVPLLAMLIAIPIPVHSVGVLPVEFLNISNGEKAAMLELNMKQINQQYLRRRDMIKQSSISLFYVPFSKLTDAQDTQMKNDIKKCIANGQYQDAILLSQKLIDLSLEAIGYYQNYYQYLLLGCVSLSYFGWIFYLLTYLARNLHSMPDGFKSARNPKLISTMKFSVGDCFFIFLTVPVISFVIVQGLPIQFYVYGLLPVVLWWFAFKNNAANLFRIFLNSYGQYWHQLIGYVLGIELFVLTFFQRWAISLVSLALLVWPWSNFKTLKRKKSQLLIYLWTCTSVGIAVFPFLPITGLEPNVYFVATSGFLSLVFTLSILFVPVLKHLIVSKSPESSDDKCFRWCVMRHVLALVVSIYNCLVTSVSQPETYHQILSWILLGNALAVPVNMMSVDVSLRLVVLFLSMASPVLLLSVGRESFFYFLFSAHLLVWFALEYQLGSQVSTGVIASRSRSTSTSSATWRRGFFFLTFLLMSFFGAGNIASVSSFDLLAVQRFISVFSPFTMMSLILLKLLIPFLLVVSTIFCLYNKINGSINQLLLVVFIFSDLLGLHFLFLVKNVGSWKEIGMSLSHYVIVESIILFVSLLLGVAHFYLMELNRKDLFSILTSNPCQAPLFDAVPLQNQEISLPPAPQLVTSTIQK